MVKATLGNFLIITIMAITGILLAKSVFGVVNVPGLSELIYAV